MGEFQLRLTSQAARDLREIVAYIARDNPVAAERFGLALVEKAEPSIEVTIEIIPIYSMLLAIIISGPSRPWSDRYLLWVFNNFQLDSTLED